MQPPVPALLRLISLRGQLIQVGAGEFPDGHGSAAGQLFDVVVRSGHVASLVVRHCAAKMLDYVRRNAAPHYVSVRYRVRHSPGEVPSHRWKARKNEFGSA
jgi:hypothetical protein